MLPIWRWIELKIGPQLGELMELLPKGTGDQISLDGVTYPKNDVPKLWTVIERDWNLEDPVMRVRIIATRDDGRIIIGWIRDLHWICRNFKTKVKSKNR